MIPTWTQLWRRIAQMWRLRKVKYRLCEDCGMTLLPDENLQGIDAGLCVECAEIDRPKRENTVGSFQTIFAPGLQQAFTHQQFWNQQLQNQGMLGGHIDSSQLGQWKGIPGTWDQLGGVPISTLGGLLGQGDPTRRKKVD